MLLFSRVVPVDPVVFAWMMLAVFVGWAIMAKGAGREYAAALVRALKRRFVDDDEPFSYDDARSLAVLQQHAAGATARRTSSSPSTCSRRRAPPASSPR